MTDSKQEVGASVFTVCVCQRGRCVGITAGLNWITEKKRRQWRIFAAADWPSGRLLSQVTTLVSVWPVYHQQGWKYVTGLVPLGSKVLLLLHKCFLFPVLLQENKR